MLKGAKLLFGLLTVDFFSWMRRSFDKVYWYISTFFRHVFNGRQFFATSCLLTYRSKSSQTGSTLKGKTYAPMWANPFLYKMTLIYMGDNNENDRVASPESVSIHLKSTANDVWNVTSFYEQSAGGTIEEKKSHKVTGFRTTTHFKSSVHFFLTQNVIIRVPCSLARKGMSWICWTTWMPAGLYFYNAKRQQCHVFYILCFTSSTIIYDVFAPLTRIRTQAG